MILKAEMINRMKQEAQQSQRRIPQPGAYRGKIIKAAEYDNAGQVILNRFKKPCIRLYLDVSNGEFANSIVSAAKDAGSYPRYGIYDVEKPDQNGTFANQKAEKMFAMLISNLDRSNKNADLTNTENWKNLQIGMVFRRRQYEHDGKLKAAIDLWYLCSTDEEALARADARAKESSDPIPAKTQVQMPQAPTVDVWNQPQPQPQPVQPQPISQPAPADVWNQQPAPAAPVMPQVPEDESMEFGDVFPDWQTRFQSIPEPEELPFM